MTGRHRLPEADGSLGGGLLLGAVLSGLVLCGWITTEEALGKTRSPTPDSRLDHDLDTIAAAPEREHGHTCRCSPRSLS